MVLKGKTMSKSFKDFYDNVRAMDAKKALQSLKESDDKYLEKRSKKYFNEEVKDEAEDIPLDEETYKKYIKN